MEDVKDSSAPGRPLTSPTLLDSSGNSSKYLVVRHLGKGVFGTVDRCVKHGTGKIVAVKTIKTSDHRIIGKIEVAMLQRLRGLDPDKCHIVRFLESFHTSYSTSLVFEALDISLYDYMELKGFVPLPLNDIRSIIQQLATAFNALKSVGVIHTDVKLDNIMLVDHLKKPFKVKLIDFGLALRTDHIKTLTGSLLQPLFCRSPEILLGLPFSEAIDMWSLGCMMADLYLGTQLFPGIHEYDVMRFIIYTLGQPADHLLDAGLYTEKFFKKKYQHWRLLTAWEFFRKKWTRFKDTRYYKLCSLDELKKECLGEENRAEADESSEFVDLLKAMLQVDASERITPSEVLAHPFIINSSRHSSHSESLPDATAMHRDGETNVDEKQSQPGLLDVSSFISSWGTLTPQHRVLLVQPMSSVNSMQEDGATEQQIDNHQISPQAVLNKTSSCSESMDSLMFESASDMSLRLESLSKTDLAAAMTEATPSLNATEAGDAAVPAVDLDSDSVDTASVPLSSAAAAAALNQMDHLDNTDSTHTTSEASEPKKKKKKKKGIRGFFSRMMKALRRRFASKDEDVE